MNGFFIVLKQVAVMMAYLLVGLGIVKSGKAKTEHAKSVSTLLIYVCGPCMVINSFLGMESSVNNALSILTFFVTTLIVQLLFIGLIYIFVKNKLSHSEYRIMTIGAVLGNVGFFGLPIVTSLFPESPVCAGYSSIYVMSMNIIVFTVGVYMITGERKYMSFKSIICNPTTVAIAISLPLYIFKISLPVTLADGVALMGKMSTPICMIVLGMRLASVSAKALLTRPFAYFSASLKLIAFPIFAYLCVAFIPWFDDVFKICILVLSAAPTGAIVLSLSEIHEQQQELSANVVLLSTILSLVTVPLVLLAVSL